MAWLNPAVVPGTLRDQLLHKLYEVCDIITNWLYLKTKPMIHVRFLITSTL